VSANPRDVDNHAARLIERLGDLDPFRLDPAGATSAKFGITVQYRTHIDSDCDIDGSYNHEQRVIKVAAAASPGRRRFSVLHELAHALGHTDPALHDWLFTFAAAGRLEEERVANAFAGAVLLPKELVDEHIPDVGPCAWDVAQLAAASTASREAVCVRASQRLRGPGLVALVQGPIVQFAATRALPFRVARGSDQGSGSFFARASARGRLRENGVRIRFPGTGNTSSSLSADAEADDDGYLFAVLMEHRAPWQPLTPIQSGPEGHEIDCDECDRTRITFAPECRTCGDRPCPDHGCACTRGLFRRAKPRHCRNCNIELPSGAPAEADLCDNCG